METKRQKIQELLEAHLPHEENRQTSVKGVHLFRSETSYPRRPVSYDSKIIIMAQGRKRVYFGNQVLTYDPAQYLVLPVPLPLECEAVATPGEPILGMSIIVDPLVVGELILEMDDAPDQSDLLPQGIYGAPMTEDIADAAIRLLRAISSKKDEKVLGPMIAREIIYRVMCGEKGEALRALAYRNRRFFQVARVLNTIHANYEETLDVRTLAMEAGMSVSTFHTSFKAVTNTSPLQYIKSIRLHKARELMNHEGLNAYSAALRVGYESPSQFSREYKRFYGTTPAKDSSYLRAGDADSI